MILYNDGTGPFTEFLINIRPTINNHMKSILNESDLSKDLVAVLMKGKRLRAGVLCAVFCSIHNINEDAPFGSELSTEVLDLACALELAHAASLVVDDMVDEDDTRRGEKTRHLLKGHKVAMLESIALLAVPYDLAANHGKFFVKSLSKTQKRMVLGAIKELFTSPDLPASKLHDMIITLKTGRLFALAAQWGAIAAGNLQDGDVVKSFAKFGLCSGKAMQISDDIVDLDEIAAGVKKSAFGSEVLLLNCIGIDGLIKDFVNDFNRCDLDIRKISSSRQAIKIALHNKQYIAINTAVDCLADVPEGIIKGTDEMELLVDIPHAMAAMMRAE